jgi:hypothetical protein
MVRQRIPEVAKENQKIALENEFLNGVEKTKLSDLSFDDLVNQYVSITAQSYLMQGLILLEIRERLISDIKFGQWIKEAGQELFLGSQSLITKKMNYARFFKNRDQSGISLTAAYEISAPINADIADKVYQAALGKNLSVAQIKAEIANAKGLLPESVNEGSGEPELMPLEDISKFMEQVLADIDELPKQEALRVLKECIKKIK